MEEILEGGGVAGKWWHEDAERGRIVCDLCPRECHLKPGDRGFCFVRENRHGQMVLSTYGKSTGFCIDPIEKKPLNHFYPGTSVLSFGTAGCNLGCKFCQNWDISKSREVAKLSEHATPSTIALAAKELGCKSVAFTYNDPVIWAEYAIDTAIACREHGVQSVAVTAGYISPEARAEFFRYMDAANVDLKAFTEEFYSKVTYSHLQPVLDTLRYLKHETNVWFEITNLVIPQENDDPGELRQMCDWILESIGPDVPIHFSAFHPDFRMLDRPRTPIETLISAYDIARGAGLNYVFVGNVHDSARQNTYCPSCKECLIERNWYELGKYALEKDHCQKCGHRIAGRFEDKPGNWGQRRQPVKLQQFANRNQPLVKISNSSSPTTETLVPQPSNSRTKNMSQDSGSPSSTNPENQAQSVLPLRLDEVDQGSQAKILRLASRFVSASVQHGSLSTNVIDDLGDMARRPVMGIFVTLKRGKQLRGCCGLVGQPVPLADALLNAAHRTAREDNRMPAISPTELPYLSLDVTLLSDTEKINAVGEDVLNHFEIGKHGLRLSQGNNAGLLLPSVPVEQGWSKREFMEGLCRKSGLAEDAWLKNNSGMVIERFDGLMIDGGISPEDIAPQARAKSIINREEVFRLRGYVGQNVMALLQGAAPTYYVPEIADGTVHGLVLSLYDGTGRVLAHLIRMSMRPGMPLQSSLFELSKTAAQLLQQSRSKTEMQIHLALTVLHDPALHGHTAGSTNAEPTFHLEGVNAAQRAIVCMMSNQRISVSYDVDKKPEELLALGTAALSAHGRPVTVYSMEYVSTLPGLVAHSAPVPQLGEPNRNPAVAGYFYPQADDERQKAVADLMPASPPAKKKVLAIMTPHAGLAYSGKVAAATWSSVEIPESILIIGPKHTPDGLDWAVAPHRHWRLSPNSRFDVDSDLSQRIAGGVQGMRMDAVAHHREHGIEIQLPILEQLAPKAKIAAVVMAGGTWSEVEIAAKQLASVLKALDRMPLLVISSDMNHYADDAENRRKDRLALEAMKSCDPKKLLDTCTENSISMCGLLPAILIMQTLRELGQSYCCEEVSYATSADAGGDTNRVVGYAGMLLCASEGASA